MNYLDIKKDLMGFWKELGYEELIKGIFSFELSEENEEILNKLYEYFINISSCSLLNEELIDKYQEIVKGGEE